MTNLQAAKEVVQRFQTSIAADSVQPEETMARFCTSDMIWRGYHPFGLLDADTAAQRFWAPLRDSFTSLQIREDVFFAGNNEIDGYASQWVVSMGHFMGLFDAPWLGIPPKLTPSKELPYSKRVVVF